MQVRAHPVEELPSHLASYLHKKTLLGSIPFAQLWKVLGGTAIFWVAYEGERPVAILPSVSFGRGPWARLQAMPDGLYAHLVPLDDGVVLHDAARAILYALRSAGFAKIFLHDFHAQFADTSGFESRECLTSVVKIASDSWEPPDQKLQSEIRKALREGVPIETFDPERHFDAFIDSMRRTEQRHGRRQKYPPSFYESLARLAKSEPRICWRVCAQGGKLAASHIYLREGEMLLNWQVFFDKAFSPLKPNQLITFTTAREMVSQGVTRLNLGASPDGAESLSHYKDKWGGEGFRYTCWTRRSWLGRLL
jgi:hypothetical protein